ncbi:kinetochore-associated protein DSN1 homolog [Corythoichthys intestinalis]|uniref:kinetochore-associated protein DSN1 homolog n=1 Tax=Corythoichthys intestinalis TaxID=161448 RepID=UPI0025A59B83|nr:kinetochore-associated protein DSN1 homolog [Corythoichthys intestinalis]
MAEDSSSTNNRGSVAAMETTNEPSPKRCPSPSAPDGIPPQKSPRVEMPLPGKQTEEAHPDKDVLEMALESATKPETCLPVNTAARRKSWRRATLSRRSLTALCNPEQTLSMGISTSIPQQERLGMLMESAMNLSLDKLQNSLLSVPNSSPELFRKKVEKLKKKSSSVTEAISNQQQSQRTEDSKVRAIRLFQNTINRIQAEINSWETLSQKHKSQAEELERKVAQNQKEVISLDDACTIKSKQYELIRSKPDYNGLLSKRRSILNTVTSVMGTQHKINRALQSVKETSQLMLKEISGRLAAHAGFQGHSPDLILDLMMTLCSSTSTK